MLYVHVPGMVSRSPGGSEGMMAVIATVLVALWLTVSEAKTEMMCLETKDGEEVPFTLTAAGQVYKQADGFVYVGGAITENWDLKCRGNASNVERTGVLMTV